MNNLIIFSVISVITFIMLWIAESDWTIKNKSQFTTTEKLKYNLMEVILTLVESTACEIVFKSEKIILSTEFVKIVINEKWSVLWANTKKCKDITQGELVMNEDSYGKYLYKYIYWNYEQIESTKSIIRVVNWPLLSESQIISRLEKDIRDAITDTEKVNEYMWEIQKVRGKYTNKSTEVVKSLQKVQV